MSYNLNEPIKYFSVFSNKQLNCSPVLLSANSFMIKP